MYNDFKIITIISDIHLGKRIVTAKEMVDMLEKNFFKPLDNMARLDAIVVTGDITDAMLTLHSDYAKAFVYFGDRLYGFAKKGVEIHIVDGTYTHDLDHLELYTHYTEDKNVVFRMYTDFTVGYMFDSYRVLFLPDKKVNTKKRKVVDNLLKDEYDLIFGHGEVDKLKFPYQESENDSVNPYIFPLDKMCKMCKGPIMFGHIHTHTVYKKKFYYVGSFTKLERVNGTHGFLVCAIYDYDRTKFKVEQYINDDSIEYYEIEMDERDFKKHDTFEMISAIKSFVMDCKPNDIFTIRIKLSDKEDLTSHLYQIEDAFKSNKKISIVKKLISSVKEDRVNKIKEKKARLGYLHDESMSEEEIIYKYFVEEVKPNDPKLKNMILSLDIIKEIIS
jgi:hypothetical protein